MLPPRLLALTVGDLHERGPRAVAGTIQEALAGGLRGVLVREPECEDGELLALFELLLAFRGETEDLWLGVHDRVHVARALPLDGVHLGFRSLEVADAREALGLMRAGRADRPCAIGLSTHAQDLVGDKPLDSGADYLFHGPVNETPSKGALPEHPDPIGIDGLQRALARASSPIWALGGIDPEDAKELTSLEGVASRLGGIAVQSGILGQSDPRRATLEYVDALSEVQP